ncbi:MAG: FprA family A-type flavoprotein [Candidatus Atabeyarchaeum deiterrae]
MSLHDVLELVDKVYWVGVRDWNRRMFDALIPLPYGTTYNAYLVKGGTRSALIDTVNPGFEKELEAKLRQVMDPDDLDFLIMNHAEPDHAGAIPHVLSLSEKTQLVTSEKGAQMAKIYYKTPERRIHVVKDGDTLDLGGRTLRFIEAPFLHWPETIFTYLVEDRILFPCDFFGAHSAHGVYDEDVEDLALIAKRYFGEIMMPYRGMGKRGVDKVKNLNIKMIAPSHGPIYKNPKRIIDLYTKWTNGETSEKVVVLYVTMWNDVEKMILPLVEKLRSEGVEVVVHNLVVADIARIAEDLVDSRAIVLGSPTVLGGAHPLAVYAAFLAKALKPAAKYGALLTSYGWGGGALKQLAELLTPLKLEVLGAMEVNGPPSEDDLSKVIELGKTIASKVKGN